MTARTMKGQLFKDAGLQATDLYQYQFKGIRRCILIRGHRIVEQSGVLVSIVNELHPFWVAIKRENNLGLLLSAVLFLSASFFKTFVIAVSLPVNNLLKTALALSLYEINAGHCVPCVMFARMTHGIRNTLSQIIVYYLPKSRKDSLL